MTHIPKRIIAADENDLIKAKKEYFDWSSGKDYGIEFLTLEQAKEKGINLDQDDDIGYPINQLSEKAKKVKQIIVVGAGSSGKSLAAMMAENQDVQKLIEMFDVDSNPIAELKTRELELFEKFKGNSRAQRRANKKKIRYK